MTKDEFKAYCDERGVPYRLTSTGLRVMDMTVLPGAMHKHLDEHGEFKVATDAVMIEPGVVAQPAGPDALAGKVATHEGNTEPGGDSDLPHEAEEDASKKLQGKLPDGFPGKAALEAAGIHTYAQVRKERDAHDGRLTHVTGIGDATDSQITEALG